MPIEEKDHGAVKCAIQAMSKI